MSEPTTANDSARLILLAFSFAAAKHRTQKRKDADQTPYLNHLVAVMTARAGVSGSSGGSTLHYRPVRTAPERKRPYHDCSGKVVRHLRGTNEVLEARYDRALSECRASLKVEAAQ